MDYNSSGNFIPKLDIGKFVIGSFDVYEEKAKEIGRTFLKNQGKSTDAVESMFSKMPTAYRGSILDKETNELIGFIGVEDINTSKNYASIVIGLEKRKNKPDIYDIVEGYEIFLVNDLGIENTTTITVINEEKMKTQYNCVSYKDATLKSLYLFEDKERSDKKYPVNVMFRNFLIAKLSVDSLIWPNKRGTIKIELEESSSEQLAEKILPTAINHYIDYLHGNNLYSLIVEVPASNTIVLDSLLKSQMNFYGVLPYSMEYKGYIESAYLFEHYPEMEKAKLTYLPKNKKVKVDDLKPINLPSVIQIDKDYRAISPKAFKDNNISLEKVVKEHISALQDREHFSIPLDEDKYIIQEGNGTYGISKLVKNFTYVLVNNSNEYCGYINVMNERGRNAVLELAIKPSLQNKGLGTKLLDKTIEVLLDNGYYAVSSYVFDFNIASNKIHKKLTRYRGKRSKSYYINGVFWDMNLYAIEKK